MKPFADSHAILRYAAIAIFAVVMALPMMVYPRYLDDLWYGVYAAPYLRGLTDTVDFGALCDTLRHHWATDNMRLCNTVFTLALLLPKWVGGALALGAMLLSLGMTTRLAGYSVGRLPMPALAAMLWMWCFCLPWYDCMAAECFQFNYIISTAIALWIALIYLRLPYRRTWVYILPGLLCGLWHEGFAGPLFGAMTILAIFRRDCRTAPRVALGCGLLAGLLWLATCPAATGRALPIEEIFRPGHLAFVTFVHPALLIMLVLLAVAYFCHSGIDRRPTVFFLIMAALSFGIHMYGPRTPRTGFWAEVCAIVIATALVCRMAPHMRRWVRIALSALLLLTVGLRLGAVVLHSFDMRDFEANVEASRTSADGVIFRDFLTEHDAPVVMWQYPDLTLYLSENRGYVPDFYDFEPGKEFTVIPIALEYVTADSGRQLTPTSPVRRHAGHLFMPCDSIRSGEFDATVTFGPMQSDKRIFYYPFISRADGHRYAYLYPWRSVVEMWLWDIEAVEPYLSTY